MRITCSAIVDDPRQKENLCECIGILGGKSEVSGNTISVKYIGDKNTIHQFMELFENYINHNIEIRI